MALRSLATALVALVSPAALAADLLVPQQYPTIQAAVNAAVAGDAVIVAPGTYNEQITIDGKAITVRSSGTASNTKIDRVNAAGNVFTVRNTPVGIVRLEGITISRTTGNAVDLSGATLEIHSIRVLNSRRGVAIGASGSLLGEGLQCLFMNADGGGIQLEHSTARAQLTNANFQACVGGLGGAISLAEESEASISGASFLNCSASQGGAVFVANGANISIHDAYAQGCNASLGGFIRLAGSGEAIITGCEIISCSATDSGGFASVEGGVLTASSCGVQGAIATVRGGLVAVDSGHFSATGLTYSNATTQLAGNHFGGVVSIGSGSATLTGFMTSNLTVRLPPGVCACGAPVTRYYGSLFGLQGSGGSLLVSDSDFGINSEVLPPNCACYDRSSVGRVLYAADRSVRFDRCTVRGGAVPSGTAGHISDCRIEGGTAAFVQTTFLGVGSPLIDALVGTGSSQLSVVDSRFEGVVRPIRTLDAASLAVSNTRFASNSGTAIEHTATGSISVAASTFIGTTSGNAVRSLSIPPIVANCFFRDNAQPSIEVGGVYVLLSSSSFCGPRVTEIATYVIEKGENFFDIDCTTDCDGDGLPNSYELTAGLATDCNANGVPDNCDADSGGADCNLNGIPDSCDIANGAADCNANGVPDTCEPDCDSDGIPNACEIASGASDCDANGIPDSCQADCDDDGVIDACEIAAGSADCNANTIPDSCEIASGLSSDFNKDGVIDACQPSMQFAGLELEIVPIVNRGLDDLFPQTAVCYRLYAKTTLSASAVLGLFGNGAYPLSLSAASGFWQSPSGGDLASQVPCNLSGALPSARYDSWFTVGLPCASGNSAQNTGLDLTGFNTGGGIADNDGIIFVQPGAAQSVAGNAKRVLLAQLTTNAAVLPTGSIDVVGRAADGVGDWIAYGQAIPAPALVDCNGNGQQDAFDIALGVARDCDQSGVPDTCEYGSASTDCNMNGIPDLCDVTSAFSSDLNGNFIPDECECSGDVDANGRVDVDDIIDVITAWGDTGDSAADLNNDGIVDAGDLVIVLAGYGSCL